ncbi:MAG: DinB-like domain protein [Gemmatimonadetes bacterium]|nr:DinB-like domain protein [Gemmatimonadota bacterium]
MPEAWLRGPIEGVDPLLMPAAHALVQAGEEIERAAAGLSPDQVWASPGGAASIGFHLRHVVGSLDRLLTYARGGSLDAHQRAFLELETERCDPLVGPDALLAGVRRAVQAALDAYRGTPREALLEPRTVGRAALPSNVIGLLFHAAEHAQRHAGQIVTTAKVVRGTGGGA